VVRPFGERYLQVTQIDSKPSPAPVKKAGTRPKQQAKTKSKWMDGFLKRPGPSLQKAIAISNANN
jgi:hypothetical protein